MSHLYLKPTSPCLRLLPISQAALTSEAVSIVNFYLPSYSSKKHCIRGFANFQSLIRKGAARRIDGSSTNQSICELEVDTLYVSSSLQ